MTPIKTVWTTFQLEGIHSYPEALTNDKLKDVSFLGHPHRHMFHFKVYIEVSHENRQIEFIQLKHQLINLIKDYYPIKDSIITFGNRSCEMIASDLYKMIHPIYSGKIIIEISEDNENGCSLIYNH